MTDRDKAMQMRNAIDQIELALMGLGEFVDIPRLFENGDDGLVLRPSLKLGDVRRVCSDLSECTRIVNSTEFDKFVGERKRDASKPDDAQ